MKKTPANQDHESREDRARTLAGKTVNSKVRSEGRTLAAREKAARTRRAASAQDSKVRARVEESTTRAG